MPGVDLRSADQSVRERHLDRRLVRVDPRDRREAELRCRDREHPGAAAHVEEARRLELLEQLERQPRGRVRARAERAARIDHDRLDSGRRLLPRWADPEAAHHDAVVELPPAVLPAARDGARRDVEAPAQHALPRRIGVHREAAFDLLEALRKELEQLRELGLAAADDDAPQRNALLIFSKRPSSALYVSESACASNSARSLRCSSLRRRGTTTLTRTRWSPRP